MEEWGVPHVVINNGRLIEVNVRRELINGSTYFRKKELRNYTALVKSQEINRSLIIY